MLGCSSNRYVVADIKITKIVIIGIIYPYWAKDILVKSTISILEKVSM